MLSPHDVILVSLALLGTLMANQCKGMPKSICVSSAFIVHDVSKMGKKPVKLSLDGYDTGQGLSSQSALLPSR